MHPLTPLVLAAAGLLLVAGVAKAVRPRATSTALRLQGLPAPESLVRVLGAGEVLVAAAALLEVPFGAAALAVSYAAFTVFVSAALLRGRPLASCGCFAEPDVPPTPVHVLVTAALAASAAAVAAGTGGGLRDLLDGSVLLALGGAGSAALVGWLTYLVLTELPRLMAELEHHPSPPAARGPRLEGGAA